MKTIKSFQVNHDKLTKGMYVSRIDGDCITYDIRMVTPNGGVYLENDGLHTFEHLFATYVRNSDFSDQIIYVGPMGCRTGFYFITRDTMSRQQALDLVRRPVILYSTLPEKFPVPSAGNVETIWTIHSRRRKIMRQILKMFCWAGRSNR